MISIKSVSNALYEGVCTQSRDVEDFKKCVDDLRQPFINKIKLKSYKQSFELEAAGVTEFIFPGRHSITEELSPKLFLNKVISDHQFLQYVLQIWLIVTGILFVLFGSKLCVDSK